MSLGSSFTGLPAMEDVTERLGLIGKKKEGKEQKEKSGQASSPVHFL
jgi:hypothetical protein